jgi:hypothetical protein
LKPQKTRANASGKGMGSQGKRMKIVNHCYYLIDKFHAQNNQLSIYNALALPDAFALHGE